MSKFDVIIIGAGPAGSCLASLLNNKGFSCAIIEKSIFPRFTLGESLLPQNMQFYEEAGLTEIFEKYHFPFKDGADFLWGDKTTQINFADKSCDGPSTTYQVRRNEFDKAITDKLQLEGVKVFFGHCLEETLFKESKVLLKIINEKNSESLQLESSFLVDASGLAKVLPRMLKIPIHPSDKNRSSVFTHIQTSTPTKFDNDKILITIDKHNTKNWFWTIPLGDNKYSLGVITDSINSQDNSEQVLNNIIESNPAFKSSLVDYKYIFPPRLIQSYSSKTEKTYGDRFLILGNSGEFLDPIFSSGVTVALKSASLAAPLIEAKLTGNEPEWEEDYIEPLQYGLNTFSAFVEAWYEGSLQKIIFANKVDTKIKSYIVSILAGYAWDKQNPYTKNSSKRLKALAQIISESAS